MKTIVDGNETPKITLLSREVLWGAGRFGSATAILVYLALAKLLIHLLTANNYGYFGDEFYWLAMAKHLDFGYVDVPPLVAYVGALWRLLFGTSLFAVHFLPALAGAVMVFFAGLLARELGGGRFAQGFTALMVLTCPCCLAVNSWFAYDPFDQLCSVILLYLFVRLIKQETPRRWIGLGIMAGLGIMTKLTMIFTVGALVLALLTRAGLEAGAHTHASPGRKSFLVKWPWLAVLIGVLLCMPYLIWQWVHGWPLITYWHSYAVSPYRPHFEILQFLWYLLMNLNPVLLPVYGLGLSYLLFHREGKKYRPLGLSFLVLLVFFGYMKAPPRLLVSACFPLLAAGAVWLERLNTRARDGWVLGWKGFLWFQRAYLGIILIAGFLIAPLVLPVLPISVLEKYLTVIPKFITEEPASAFSGNRLPFAFAYRFGWPELVEKVAEVYHSLPEADRKKCVIWADSYGHAGAIDLLGKKYGLPDAISNHYSYQFWGPDPSHSGVDPEVVIKVGGTVMEGSFAEKTVAAFVIGNPYAASWNRYQSIYLCRKPTFSLKEVWPKLANFY
ncbi:MAG TPA: glycosyltransferase family 39 protein [Bacillota bacterium]|nr:glycosyltransferase family 39 protein [Bacillota bacterium]